ncbi:hypothetical protein [Fimbriiglobus ruber]|uniref:Uncharacterized protein n=1 Tax=Fimbriiglobus ruber TaxID=1908690 RepID=A0A225DGZ9_9BACT|nr:hypothetical protein [Fimbriiglobus ruber]OWK40790.1 hypothetical protein FRUB_04682 [Fimbriiglobus ruber]
MTLVLTFALTALALTALFWGVSIFIQGYLYSDVADRLPLRALVGGVAIACVVTLWVYANTRASHKDKYGTLFEFSATSTREITEFEAVRVDPRTKDAKPKETTVKYHRLSATKDAPFVDSDGQKPFRLSDSSTITSAILVTDEDGKKARFDAVMDRKDKTLYDRGPNRNDPVQFREQGGPRTMSEDALQLVASPNSGALVVALLLNLGHLLAWFLVFWVVLRYSIGHSLTFTAILGGATMFIAVPLLFNLNAVPPALPAAATAPAK